MALKTASLVKLFLFKVNSVRRIIFDYTSIGVCSRILSLTLLTAPLPKIRGLFLVCLTPIVVSGILEYPTCKNSGIQNS